MTWSSTLGEAAQVAGETHLLGRVAPVTAPSRQRHDDAIQTPGPGHSLSNKMVREAEQVLHVLKPRVTFDEAQVASRALMPPRLVGEVLEWLADRGLVRITIVDQRRRYQTVPGRDPNLDLV